MLFVESATVSICAAGNVYGILPMSSAKQISIYLMVIHQVGSAAIAPRSAVQQKQFGLPVGADSHRLAAHSAIRRTRLPSVQHISTQQADIVHPACRACPF
jgi:hypothetical protein